jgi:hypothetical protein
MPNLEPEVAIAKFTSGEPLIVPIEQLASQFAMHPHDFKPFLASGELTAHIIEVSPCGKMVRVGLDLQEIKGWMVRHNIGMGGKPLLPSSNSLLAEARWIGFWADGKVEIPSEFLRSLVDADWRAMRETNEFDHGQCVRLWRHLGRRGGVPKRLSLYVDGNDVQRLVNKAKE